MLWEREATQDTRRHPWGHLRRLRGLEIFLLHQPLGVSLPGTPWGERPTSFTHQVHRLRILSGFFCQPLLLEVTSASRSLDLLKPVWGREAWSTVVEVCHNQGISELTGTKRWSSSVRRGGTYQSCVACW